MKDNRRFYFRMILAVFILALLVSLPAMFSGSSEDKDITSIQEVVDIGHDGTVHVTETVDYDFSDSYNTVSMDIPLRSPQTVSNLAVDTPGYYNNVSQSVNDTTDRVTVQLSTDQEDTTDIDDESVNITYSYDYDYGLTSYNDVAELEYILWDSDSDRDIGGIDLQLNLPGDGSSVETWNNPPYYNDSTGWSNSTTLNIHYDTSDMRDTLIFRMIMPSDYIDATGNVQVVDMDAKEDIESDQATYMDNISNNNTTTYAIIILSIVLIITPFIIGYRYRNKEGNAKLFEEDPLDVKKPIILNILAEGDLDKVDINAFYVTILDLIDRGVFEVVKCNSLKSYIKINIKQESSLDEFEKGVVDYFRKFTDNKFRLNVNQIRKDADPDKFQSFIYDWCQSACDNVLNMINVEDYYNDYRFKLYQWYAILSVILVILVYLFLLRNMVMEVPTYPLARNLLIVLFIEAVFVYLLPKRTSVQWTIRGNALINRCKKLEESAEDYDKLSKSPPESIKEWKQYLITLTALGKSKKATETMRKYFIKNGVNRSEREENLVVSFVYSGIFKEMVDTFESLNEPETEEETTTFKTRGNNVNDYTLEDDEHETNNKEYKDNNSTSDESETINRNEYPEDDKKEDDDFWDDFEYFHYFQ